MIKQFNIKTPSNIYIWWNFGSLISLFMFMQIMVGLMIAMNYIIMNNPFTSSFFIYYNINFGWGMRMIHSNLTSLIFILMIMHLKRNLKFNTFLNKKMWFSGMLMMIIFMLIAFLGYSLIWTQMSYWGMMVITNFISTIPMVGKLILNWIWGNFNINIILINRFFVIHFFLPMITLILITIHINILHINKSSNPLGLNNKIDLISLNPYSIIKDLAFMMTMFIFFINLIFFFPFILNNFDNFNEMNYFNTPNHIEPEWYFLFFYSMLRSIPNKLSGLMMMFSSLILFMLMPLIMNTTIQNNKFNLLNNLMNNIFIYTIIFISILGSKMIEYPYENLNIVFINLMFSFFLFNYTKKLIKFILKMN